MDEDRLFHLLDIGVQIIGLGILVFKGGNYIGKATTMFTSIFKNLDELRAAQITHQMDDDNKHDKIVESLTDVKVAIAGIKK